MVSNAWKAHERETARYFGTTRRLRGSDFSQSDLDVLVNVREWYGSTPLGIENLVVECKYSKEHGIVTKFLGHASGCKGQIPLVRVSDFVLCYLSDFKSIYRDFISTTQGLTFEALTDRYRIVTHDGTEPKYLRDYLDQATAYIEVGGRKSTHLPILSIAKASTSGRLLAFSLSSLARFHTTIEV